jgi:hypothetical protein
MVLSVERCSRFMAHRLLGRRPPQRRLKVKAASEQPVGVGKAGSRHTAWSDSCMYLNGRSERVPGGGGRGGPAWCRAMPVSEPGS